MFTNLVLVALGGAAGSVLRYVCQRSLNLEFPYGTMVVNVLGCLVIGLLMGFFSRHDDEQRRLLFVTGFCGGFTTFSSFTYESIRLLSDQRWLSFILYTTISLLAGLLATYLGYKFTS